ncbi:hypothetical protein [Streptomyces cyaneofuscatus]|uniref:hypothetical protein n=1 Tax=Streptomyces cyaneofuscatus TaxID=66883 RepID=UPI00366131B1
MTEPENSSTRAPRQQLSVANVMLTPTTPLPMIIQGFGMSEQSRSTLSWVDFDAAWCVSDLGKYRACQYTYERYSLASLPPLDSRQFTGAFRWLGDAGDLIPRQVMKLNGLARDLAARGLTLPQDFVTFQTTENLYGSLDDVSVTGCWTNLSDPLPSLVEPDAFLVRFFRD